MAQAGQRNAKDYLQTLQGSGSFYNPSEETKITYIFNSDSPPVRKQRCGREADSLSHTVTSLNHNQGYCALFSERESHIWANAKHFALLPKHKTGFNLTATAEVWVCRADKSSTCFQQGHMLNIRYRHSSCQHVLEQKLTCSAYCKSCRVKASAKSLKCKCRQSSPL